MPQTWENRVVDALACLGSHLRIAGEVDPSPVVLGEVLDPFAEPTRRLQVLSASLTDLVTNGGLSKHVATSLLRSYVMSASQHVLRNNFTTKQQAAEFDDRVLAALYVAAVYSRYTSILRPLSIVYTCHILLMKV